MYYTFLYISLPFLHNYDVKLPSSTFYGGYKQATNQILSLFLNLDRGPRNSNRGCGGGGEEGGVVVGFNHD